MKQGLLTCAYTCAYRLRPMHGVVIWLIVVSLAINAHADTAADTLATLIAHKTTPVIDHRVSDSTLLSHQEVWGDHWGLVYIFSAHCPYCQRFSPVLATVSQQYAIPVYAYAIDGQGLPDYPAPLTANDTVLQLFYGDQPVLYPATFLVHLHSKRFVPLTRGMVDHATLQQTLQAILSDQRITASLARRE